MIKLRHTGETVKETESMKVIEVQVFKFDELSEDVQENIIDHWRVKRNDYDFTKEGDIYP